MEIKKIKCEKNLLYKLFLIGFLFLLSIPLIIGNIFISRVLTINTPNGDIKL